MRRINLFNRVLAAEARFSAGLKQLDHVAVNDIKSDDVRRTVRELQVKAEIVRTMLRGLARNLDEI